MRKKNLVIKEKLVLKFIATVQFDIFESIYTFLFNSSNRKGNRKPFCFFVYFIFFARPRDDVRKDVNEVPKMGIIKKEV